MDTDWHTFDDPASGEEAQPLHVLILGGTGFLGRHISRAFISAGWAVTAYHSTNFEPFHHPRYQHIIGDRRDADTFQNTLASRYFDCTIDLIGHDEESADSAAEALFGRTQHHVHLSSDAVYRVLRGIPRPWREEDDHGPLIDRTQTNAAWFDSGVANRKAEEVVRETVNRKGFPATIVRTSHVSGPYDSSLGDFIHMLRILDGEPLVVPQPSGSFRHILASDLAAIILRIASHPRKTIGRTYNAAGASIVSLTEYLELLATLLQKPIRLAPVPADKCEALLADPSLLFYYPHDAIPDTTRLELDLAFRPRGIEQFLPRVVEWFQREYKGDPPPAFHILRKRESELL
jgi:nucleoside-diphosphate-sugar epimerase